MNKLKLVNTIVFTALLFSVLHSKAYAVGSINYYSSGKQVSVITCGDSYNLDIPDYSNKTIWLRQIKNGVTIIDRQYYSASQVISQCNIDEGTYMTTAYSFDINPNTGLNIVGDLIATGTLTIKAKPPAPIMAITNLTNSGRTRDFWTEDFIKIKIKSQFLNQNQPVELCRLHLNETVCVFTSSYTNSLDGSWEFVYQIHIGASVLGKAEDWLRINGMESNRYSYSVVTKPTDPSLSATCYLNQFRPHANVWVGDKITWSIFGRPSGYQAYWYGSKDNVPDANGVLTGHSSNNEWLSEVYPPNSVGNYTRWVQFRDKANNFVCNSNSVTFSVINPPASSSLMIKSPVSSVSARSASLLGNLLANLWKLLGR